MASLLDMRASVIAGVTEGRPTNDFVLPDRLVDHYIFTYAAKDLYEQNRRKRGAVSIQPWMMTRFECMVPELSESVCLAGDSCKAQYGIDLPFSVLSLPDDIGIRAWIQNSMTRINYVAPGMISMNPHSRYPASYENPSFTRIGDRLLFWGGNRKFDSVKILVEAAVIGVIGESEYITCAGDMNVPIPSDLVAGVEEKVIARILHKLSTEKEDLVDDGTDNTIK
jgi:hypothetical protein